MLRAGGLLLGSATFLMAQGDDTTAELRQELKALRGDYEQRISRLESRIHELEGAPAAVPGKKPTPRHAARAERPPERSTQAGKDPDSSGHTGQEPNPEDKVNAGAASSGQGDRQAQERAARQEVDKKFREDTETRDLARSTTEPNPLADRIEDVLQGYMDITGYFRAGYGRANEGGPQQGFGIPGVAKYRLGNEAENYGELAFSKTFYPAGAFTGRTDNTLNGPVARMTYRMSFYNPYEDYGSANHTDFASPEVWGSLANIIPNMPDARIWAGNRFYRRHDIHINDFYFWDMSGGGGGIEDITLGNGKLALAWIGDGSQSSLYGQQLVVDPLNLAGFSKTNIDLRYYDWAFFGGTGEVGLIYASANSGVDSLGGQAEKADGVALSLVRTDKGFLDPNSLHVISAQLGSGPAKTFTSGFESFSGPAGTYIRPDPNDSWRFRATDQVVVKPLDNFSIGSALVYQHTDFGGYAPSQQWVSGGLRPIWQITDVFSLAFEGGVDWVSDTANGNGGTLGKLTLAPQVALGSEFFSRPVLRAFVTYAAWSDGLQGDVGGARYSSQNTGWTWGMQMESWW